MWLYSIHGRNAEIFQILKDHDIEPEDETYNECLKESIKCIHNDVANYIQKNFCDEEQQEHSFDNNINSYGYHFHNYTFILDQKFAFYYACQYDYYKIVEFLIQNKNVNINDKINVGKDINNMKFIEFFFYSF